MRKHYSQLHQRVSNLVNNLLPSYFSYDLSSVAVLSCFGKSCTRHLFVHGLCKLTLMVRTSWMIKIPIWKHVSIEKVVVTCMGCDTRGDGDGYSYGGDTRDEGDAYSYDVKHWTKVMVAHTGVIHWKKAMITSTGVIHETKAIVNHKGVICDMYFRSDQNFYFFVFLLIFLLSTIFVILIL